MEHSKGLAKRVTEEEFAIQFIFPFKELNEEKKEMYIQRVTTSVGGISACGKNLLPLVNHCLISRSVVGGLCVPLKTPPRQVDRFDACAK